jgi:transposase
VERAAVDLLNTLRTLIFAPLSQRSSALQFIDDVEAYMRHVDTQLLSYHTLIAEQNRRLVEQDRTIAEEIARRKESEQKQVVLEERLRLLISHRFGKHSEHWKPDEALQAQLFNEIEAILQTATEALSAQAVSDAATVAAKPTVKKQSAAAVVGHGGREMLPANLPREVTIIDLPEDQKVCAPCGNALVKIGEETSERLAIKPFEYYVEKTIRYVYAPLCDCPEQTVTSAPVPQRILPKSVATPSLLAMIIAGKFCDALPFYRQAAILKDRHGIPVSRATMARWAYEVHKQLTPLTDLILTKIRSGSVLHMDETRLRVLHENGKKKDGQSWMWCAAGYGEATPAGDPGGKLIYFHYGGSRSLAVAQALLGTFKGVLMSDAYAAYNTPAARHGITQAACMAHVRRYYIEAAKVQPHNEAIQKVLAYIKELYHVEADQADSRLEDRLEARQKRSKPIMDAFWKYVIEQYRTAIPSSTFGTALSYTINVWERLLVYLDNPLVPIDNNLVENAIRPFAVGRKNWLFSDQDAGAEASAVFYTLIETARANTMEPMPYLRFLFVCLEKFGPVAMPWDQLLPTPALRAYGDAIGIPYRLG